MATGPYHKWLGIPVEEQPPSHYRLLGVPQFETDADVIETAAEQRTLLLRTFQTGPDAELAEQLLNEIAAARVCLLKPAARAEYDDSLRDAVTEIIPPKPSGMVDRHYRKKARTDSYLVPIIVGGLLLIPLIIALWWFIGSDGSDIAAMEKAAATHGLRPISKIARHSGGQDSGPLVPATQRNDQRSPNMHFSYSLSTPCYHPLISDYFFLAC